MCGGSEKNRSFFSVWTDVIARFPAFAPDRPYSLGFRRRRLGQALGGVPFSGAAGFSVSRDGHPPVLAPRHSPDWRAVRLSAWETGTTILRCSLRPCMVHEEASTLAFVDTSKCTVTDVLPSSLHVECIDCEVGGRFSAWTVFWSCMPWRGRAASVGVLLNCH